MKHYPVFLDLKDRPVLVVGAGKIALRKTVGLLESGARITVVAPDILPEFETLPVRLVRLLVREAWLWDAVLYLDASPSPADLPDAPDLAPPMRRARAAR